MGWVNKFEILPKLNCIFTFKLKTFLPQVQHTSCVVGTTPPAGTTDPGTTPPSGTTDPGTTPGTTPPAVTTDPGTTSPG